MSEDGDADKPFFVCVFQDEQLTASYRLETATKLKQVEELSDIDQPRLFHATQCSQCGGPLDLPSVHFMCKHSFHQRSASAFLSYRKPFPSHLSLHFSIIVDAWVITIPSAHFACTSTASYRKFAVITNGLPTSMIFSWLTSKRMGSMLWLPRLAEACSIGQELGTS
jgi:hypothetical protein